MRRLIIILTALALVGCSTAQITKTSPDGSGNADHKKIKVELYS